MDRTTTRADGAMTVIASYRTYADAERAVAALAEHDFPVDRVSIVGRGLTLVEDVIGRRSALDVAVGGAGASALAGGLIGLVFGAIGTPFAGLVFMLWGLVTGAVIGAVLGWLVHRSGGARSFDSLSGVRAERFDVVAEAAYAAEAAALVEDAVSA